MTRHYTEAEVVEHLRDEVKRWVGVANVAARLDVSESIIRRVLSRRARTRVPPRDKLLSALGYRLCWHAHIEKIDGEPLYEANIEAPQDHP